MALSAYCWCCEHRGKTTLQNGVNVKKIPAQGGEWTSYLVATGIVTAMAGMANMAPMAVMTGNNRPFMHIQHVGKN